MENLSDQKESEVINAVPKKRGRKPKIKTEEDIIKVTTPKKKRGRKPSGKIYEVNESTGMVTVPDCIIAHLPLSEQIFPSIPFGHSDKTIVLS